LNRLKAANPGSPLKLKGLKLSYMTPIGEVNEEVDSEAGCQNFMKMRLLIRNYLRELNLYSSFT
jgi:hypothetical protein